MVNNIEIEVRAKKTVKDIVGDCNATWKGREANNDRCVPPMSVKSEKVMSVVIHKTCFHSFSTMLKGLIK